MTPPPDEPPYTRRDKRVSLDADVSMAFEQKRNMSNEQTLNLSAGGMFVESEKGEAVGALAQFEIRLEGESQPIEGVGEVVWVRKDVDGAGRPAGMGVRFLALDPRSREKIESLLIKQDVTSAPPADAGAEVDEKKQEEAPPPAALAPGEDWPGAEETWPWLESSGTGSSAVPSLEGESTSVLNEAGLYYSAGGRRRRPWWRIPLLIGVVLIVLGVGFAAVQHFFLSPQAEPIQGLSLARPSNVPARPTATATPAASRPEAGPSASPSGPKLPSTSETMTVTAKAPSPSTPNAQTGTGVASKNPHREPAVPSAQATPVPRSTRSASVLPSRHSSEASAPESTATRILKIDWKSTAIATSVTVHANGRFAAGSYDVMHLGGPKPRLVLRLRGIDSPYSPATLAVGSTLLERIRSGLHRAGMGTELHLVFDLSGATVDLDRIEANGDQLRLVFGHGGQSHGRG